MAVEKFQKFGFEILSLVVLCLPVDVFRDLADVRLADGKRPAARLPGKICELRPLLFV